MITTADTLELMTLVAACHRRTAPRMDDPEATVATARIWAELFNHHSFEPSELVDAVKKRAVVLSDAPEPADIIRVARSTRQDALDRGEGLNEAASQADDREVEIFAGDAKAARDPADYPAEWTSDQRNDAYWAAHRVRAIPSTPAAWRAILAQSQLQRRSRKQAMA